MFKIVTLHIPRVPPFSTLVLKVRCQHPTYGFELGTCDLTGRVYVRDIVARSTAATLAKKARHRSALVNSRDRYRGAYVMSVGDVPVFTATQAKFLFSQARDDEVSNLRICLALEPLPSAEAIRRAEQEWNILDFDAEQYDVNDIAPEGPEELTLGFSELLAINRIRNFDASDSADADDDLDLEDVALLIQSLQSELHIDAITSGHITDEEAALGNLTRRKLKTLSTWQQWLD